MCSYFHSPTVYHWLQLYCVPYIASTLAPAHSQCVLRDPFNSYSFNPCMILISVWLFYLHLISNNLYILSTIFVFVGTFTFSLLYPTPFNQAHNQIIGGRKGLTIVLLVINKPLKFNDDRWFHLVIPHHHITFSQSAMAVLFISHLRLGALIIKRL